MCSGGLDLARRQRLPELGRRGATVVGTATLASGLELRVRFAEAGAALPPCIVEADARIAASALRGSLVGRSARIDGFAGTLDIGDHSRIGTPALDR